MQKALFALFLLPVFSAGMQAAPKVAPLFHSGDTVALVGNTFFERARLYGEIETALQLAAGSDVKNLKFRNLGWSGDSVLGDARSYFGPPQEGRDRLSKVMSELNPAVVMLCYGTGEAMSVDSGWTEEKADADRSAGGMEESLNLFIEKYRELIKLIKESAGDSVREFVLISPPPLENAGEFLPDQTENNRRLARFRDAIRKLAEDGGYRFVDLFGAMGGDDFDGSAASPALTENGIHYGSSGYRIAARHMVEELGYGESVRLLEDPSTVEKLKSQIVEKNRLFFHRWRPANETYLFLFRKHEQGQNAKEIPEFDPLIAEQESAIEKTRLEVLRGKAKN